MNRTTIGIIITAALAFVTAITGCGDTCGDIVCGPAPPLLQVEVIDTMLDSVRLPVQRTNPARIDTIDTMVVVQVRITDAVVTLHRVQGADTVAFDTLAPSGDLYTLNDAANLPSDPFIVRAARGSRRTQAAGLTLRKADGCCPYSVVGFYTLQLPRVP